MYPDLILTSISLGSLCSSCLPEVLDSISHPVAAAISSELIVNWKPSTVTPPSSRCFCHQSIVKLRLCKMLFIDDLRILWLYEFNSHFFFVSALYYMRNPLHSFGYQSFHALGAFLF